MPLFPSLTAGMEAQVTRRLMVPPQPVDRTQYACKPWFPFHRRSLTATLTSGLVIEFFTTASVKNPFICTLPGGKTTTNEPGIVRSIGFQMEGLTVNESTQAVTATASYYTDVVANRAAQLAGQVQALMASYVEVKQNNLTVAEGRLVDFQAGNGVAVSGYNVTTAATDPNSVIGNGAPFPGARLMLPDAQVVLPDRPISVKVSFGAAFALQYVTSLCCELIGEQITVGGIGVN